MDQTARIHVDPPTPLPRAAVSSPARPPIEHEVKSWPGLFEAAMNGSRTHDLRPIGDRDYRVGDTLLLREFEPATGEYTGRELRVAITYITSATQPCALSSGALSPDFAILSIDRIADETPPPRPSL